MIGAKGVRELLVNLLTSRLFLSRLVFVSRVITAGLRADDTSAIGAGIAAILPLT